MAFKNLTVKNWEPWMTECVILYNAGTNANDLSIKYGITLEKIGFFLHRPGAPPLGLPFLKTASLEIVLSRSANVWLLAIAKKRTDQDLNFKWVFLTIGALTIPIFLVYAWISNNLLVSGVMAVFAILFAFIASAITGYMAGLVGSSNQPTSGVTVSILLLTCLILLGFGLSGDGGAYGTAILIAAVIACCAAISGDVLQSMTSGQMIGATPYKQQLAELIGIIVAAPVLAIVISALHQAYTIGSNDLPAPASVPHERGRPRHPGRGDGLAVCRCWDGACICTNPHQPTSPSCAIGLSSLHPGNPYLLRGSDSIYHQ